MSLAKKTAIIIGGLSILLFVVLWLVSNTLILNSFNRLESESATHNAEQVKSAFEHDQNEMLRFLSDWAGWDDSYRFVEGRYPSYIKSNLYSDAFKSLNLDAMVFVDNAGKVICAKAFDFETKSEVPLPAGLLEHIRPGKPLLRTGDTANTGAAGILMLHGGPAMAVSRPILHNDGAGPILASLVWVRMLKKDEAKRFSDITRLDVELRPYADASMPPDMAAAKGYLITEHPLMVRVLDENIIAGYARVNDLYGNPAIMFKIKMKRDISSRGREVVKIYQYFLLGVSALILVAMTAYFHRDIVRRITLASHQARDIGIAGDFSGRLTVAGNDEIGELSTAVNLMLSDLEKLQGELREAKETAEDATKLKDHFVSLVAHDLRSPLSTIMGMLRLLQSGRHQISEEKRADVIAKVIHSAHNMITVIEDLLNISLLQTGKIQPVPAFFDGARVVESCINAMEFTADGKGVKVVNGVVPGTRLYADFTMFGEVLKNLISNSIKFCRAGDTVTVFVPEGEPSTIAVRDTGVGINPAFYPDLFRHEVKTTSSGTGEERGTGLGLPYSRDIMLAHGGDLSADAPKPGEGALFRARLPLVRPVVLVVDDDERLLEDIALLMAQDKLEVIKASSEDEAVRIIETRKPHLVIANSHLTGADALSLVQRLKEDNPRATVPLIVITPENSGISGESLMPLGVRDVLAKPFKVHDLISRVKKYVA